MKYVVLLGDSIFDNAAYVNGGLDVIAHLRNHIPEDWQATLRAVDGSVVRGVHRQIENLPPDITHLIISIGGNDALQESGLLEQRAQSAAEVIDRLANISEEFQRRYQEMLQTVLRLRLPTAICTIYYPRFAEPTLQRMAVMALAIFNDVIIKEAFVAGTPLLDLRLICNHDEDYANPIEPSEAGGRKIAAAITRLLHEHPFDKRRTEVFIS